MSIHLLCYAHGNQHTKTNDAIRDTFIVIVWDASSIWGENNYMRFF